MKLVRLFIATSIISFGHISQSAIELKPHEQWWDKNVETKLHDFTWWLGDANATSRKLVRHHVKNKNYKSILDIPSGLCTDFFGYKQDKISIEYYGVDITPFLVKRGVEMGANVLQGSIENIPYDDSTIEVCYARHILEHLDYYQKALSELIRVAKKEVIIVFFKVPFDKPDYIYLDTFNDALLYHNQYNKSSLESYIMKNKKVKIFEWEKINEEEIILHIYLNS